MFRTKKKLRREIKNDPKIKRNKFFTGSGPAQTSLDYALFCLIANAPSDANIHDSIKTENITDLNMKTFDLKIQDGFIPLDNLKSLNNLIIDLEIFQELNKGRDKWFENSNVKRLDLVAKGSLKFFNNLNNQIKLEPNGKSVNIIISKSGLSLIHI